MNISNNKILITGGASGIGLGLTERFIQEHNTVIVCGRRADVLKEVQQRFPSVITKVCDLCSEEDRIALYQWVKENHNDVNVLINNAGIQQWMNVTDEDFYQRSVQEITTNITAPIHLTSLFLGLPSLETIMNVTSGLAYLAYAKVPVYCGTKSCLHSFTLSLRYLLKDKNMEVIEIIPPALNTDLGGKGLHDTAPPVSEFIHSIFEQLKQGKQELTFGLSETLSKATPDEIQTMFNRMNPE